MYSARLDFYCNPDDFQYSQIVNDDRYVYLIKKLADEYYHLFSVRSNVYRCHVVVSYADDDGVNALDRLIMDVDLYNNSASMLTVGY